jgi:hypothetical protein
MLGDMSIADEGTTQEIAQLLFFSRGALRSLRVDYEQFISLLS